MNLGRAIKYPFNDRDWAKKIALGTALLFIPIVNFAVYGYLAEVIDNVARGIESSLPDWKEFGSLFVDGFLVMVASTAYILIPGTLYFVGYFMARENPGQIVSSGAVYLLIVGFALMIPAGIFESIGLIRFSVGWRQISEFFDIRSSWHLLRQNLGKMIFAFIAWYVPWVVLIIFLSIVEALLSAVLAPICGSCVYLMVVAMIAFPMTVLYQGHLFGQVAREVGLVKQ